MKKLKFFAVALFASGMFFSQSYGATMDDDDNWFMGEEREARKTRKLEKDLARKKLQKEFRECMKSEHGNRVRCRNIVQQHAAKKYGHDFKVSEWVYSVESRRKFLRTHKR